MNIIMLDGSKPTEEVKAAVRGYDVYTMYIDSSTDMHKAIAENDEIKKSFERLGIKEIRQ